jgi:hypothetical protein
MLAQQPHCSRPDCPGPASKHHHSQSTTIHSFLPSNEIPALHTDRLEIAPLIQRRIFEMALAFEPSLSMSLNRPPMTATAPSMADTLPNINFGFDELRDRMAKFTAKFDAFIEQGRKRVLEERNQFRMNVAELQGTDWQ